MFLDNMFSTLVAVVLSVTLVLAFGEVFSDFSRKQINLIIEGVADPFYMHILESLSSI